MRSRVEDAIYKYDATRQKRIEFNQERHAFINANSHLKNIHLAKYNLILDQKTRTEAEEANRKDWERLEAEYQISQVKAEAPMCILTPGLNNNARFRIEQNLNSIFSQNYTNYRVIIINDASDDLSGRVYREYLKFYNIPRDRYVYVENKRRAGALQNIYENTIRHCGSEDIVMSIDADDELVGWNVLPMFNWAFAHKKAGVLYSNFYWYKQTSWAEYGFT